MNHPHARSLAHSLTLTLLHATGEDQLIARAKEVFETMTGVKDDSVLAPDFRFEFPVVRVDLGRRAVNSPGALTRATRYARSPGVARQGQVPRRRSGVLPELGHPEHELERMAWLTRDSVPIPTRPTHSLPLSLSLTLTFVHQAYHYRVDPYEPNRVWFTIRNSGTHTGALKFAGKTFEGTVGT